MPRFEVVLKYDKEPAVGYTIDAYNKDGAIVMAKERARQEGWSTRATFARAIEEEFKATSVGEPKSDQQTLRLSFIVREDLPSERSEEYRALILRALEKYTLNDATVEERVMIDRIMCDHETDNTLVSVIEARRRLIERQYGCDDLTTAEIQRNSDAIEALTAIIGY